MSVHTAERVLNATRIVFGVGSALLGIATVAMGITMLAVRPE